VLRSGGFVLRYCCTELFFGFSLCRKALLGSLPRLASFVFGGAE
jgi:hypothetical protein